MHDRFVVLNPINRSLSVLPPIPFPICRHSSRCYVCRAHTLKLVVQTEQKGGRKTTLSSSDYKAYKAYVMLSSTEGLTQPPTMNCQIVVYDSMTKLWAQTGAEWEGTITYFTRLFLTNDALLVSTGRLRGQYLGEHRHGLHDVMYKFENGGLVGIVEAPWKMEREDRYCCNYIDHINNYEETFPPYSCGCISSTVFEAEGKIFLFQQTSWVGDYGPNCISAQIWELDCRKMIWRKLSAGPMHLLQSCTTEYSRPFDLANVMFIFKGILFVVRHSKFRNNFGGDFHYVAGFDIVKKTWCKVPETTLKNLRLSLVTFSGRNLADLDNFEFQPNVHTRA